MSPNKNFKIYRRRLAELGPSEPAIPFIPLFLSDLVFSDEVGPTVSEGIVDMVKVRSISQKINFITSLGTRSYVKAAGLTTRKDVEDYFLSNEIWTEDEVYRLSELLEGRKKVIDPRRMLMTGRKTSTASLKYLGDRNRNILLSVGEQTEFKKDQVVVKEGTNTDQFFIVISGQIRLERKFRATGVQDSDRRLPRRSWFLAQVTFSVTGALWEPKRWRPTLPMKTPRSLCRQWSTCPHYWTPTMVLRFAIPLTHSATSTLSSLSTWPSFCEMRRTYERARARRVHRRQRQRSSR